MEMTTPWTALVDREKPLPEYPRPQLARQGWINLNGPWDYAINDSRRFPQCRFRQLQCRAEHIGNTFYPCVIACGFYEIAKPEHRALADVFILSVHVLVNCVYKDIRI